MVLDVILGFGLFLKTLLMPILAFVVFVVVPIAIIALVIKVVLKDQKNRITTTIATSIVLLTPIPIVHSMGGTFMYSSYAYVYYFSQPSFRQDGIQLLAHTWYIVLLGMIFVGGLSFMISKFLPNKSRNTDA